MKKPFQITERIGKQMGKETVSSVNPGFVTSRINAMIGNEALRRKELGSRGHDKPQLGLNHLMGPFELVDLV
jgi:3-hydroxyacyl-CoA dehydrogenase